MIVLIRPKNGAQVRDPDTLEVLPAEGKKVELGTYWRRQIEQGYIEIIEETTTIILPETSACEEFEDGDLV